MILSPNMAPALTQVGAEPRLSSDLHAGVALGTLLRDIDPQPRAERAVRFQIDTADGEWCWSGSLSQAGAALVVALLEAEAARQMALPPVTHLRAVPKPEVS